MEAKQILTIVFFILGVVLIVVGNIADRVNPNNLNAVRDFAYYGSIISFGAFIIFGLICLFSI